MKTVRIDLPILLPDIPDARDACVQRLQGLLNQRRGVSKTHVIESGTSAVLCLHYDPNVLTLDSVEQLAKVTGAKVRERYGHRVWPLRAVAGAQRTESASARSKADDHQGAGDRERGAYKVGFE